jgi:hypothetical protein
MYNFVQNSVFSYVDTDLAMYGVDVCIQRSTATCLKGDLENLCKNNSVRTGVHLARRRKSEVAGISVFYPQ